MKRIIRALTALLGPIVLLGASATPAAAQSIAGQIIASQYGQWQLQGTRTNTFIFSPDACQVSGGNHNFAAPKEGNLVRIVDPEDSALDETLVAGPVNIRECSVQLSPKNRHIPPFYLVSGTGGLQEAIDANLAPNSIILTEDWYKLGGSTSIIAEVKGSSLITLVDITTTPYTWYDWNGSEYTPVLTGGTPAGDAGAIQYNDGTQFAGVNITGLMKGNGTSAPTAAVPGTDYQPPTSFNCTGGIGCSETGNTYNFTYSGAAGSGAVATFSPYQDAFGPSAGTEVGPTGNSSTAPNGLSGAQMQLAINAQNSSSLLRINGPEQPFANPNGYPVQDNRFGSGATVAVTSLGAACDTSLAFGNVTANSTTLTLTNWGRGLNSTMIDPTTPYWVSIVGKNSSGVPERFDTYLTAVSGSTATMATASPFTSVTNASITIGNDDTTALENAITVTHNGTAKLIFPSTGVCWTRTQPFTLTGESFSGFVGGNSGLVGGAGLDTITGGGNAANQEIDHMNLYVDARIDAAHCGDGGTFPSCTSWIFDNNGTVTDEAPVYRPVMLTTADSNNPLGPGWIRGSEPWGLYAFNGVATTTSGSAAICVLTSTTPPVGADIVFPQYGGGAVIHTTVASTAGTCASGTPLTLTAGTGMTAVTQNEFFYGEAPSASASGTGVQEINTAIPATGRTFPMEVTLKNPNNPEPGAQSDFAPFGLVKIDSEECTYYGTSSFPANSGQQWLTLTACAQQGTTAAAHAVGAAIVPLNPYESALPWPITTINADNEHTPPDAEFFPAFNVGNAVISQPITDGTAGVSGGFSSAYIHDNKFLAWPTAYVTSQSEDPYNFQGTNSTAAIYTVPIPFNTRIDGNYIAGPAFGFFEGLPSTNTFNNSSTADTNHFDDNHVSAHYVLDVIGGGTWSFNNNQLFSQGGAPNTGYPGYNPGSATGTGAGLCLAFTAIGPDDLTGFAQGVYNGTSEVFDAVISGNTYCEAETGSLANSQAIDILDFNDSTWTGSSDMAGGTIFLGGANNTLTPGPVNNGPVQPFIINGTGNTITNTTGLVSSTNPLSNTWANSPLLNWGFNNCVSGQSVDGSGRLTVGCQATQPGQTQETFATGNLTAPYPNSSSAFFYPITFHPGSAVSLPVVNTTYDSTAGNVSQSYAGCNVGTNTGIEQCQFYMNGNGASPDIGANNQIVPGEYVVTVGIRECNAYPCTDSPQTVGLEAAAGSAGIANAAVPISTTWTNQRIGIVNFSTVSGQTFQFYLDGVSTTGTNVELSYISLTPVWQDPTAQAITLPVTTPTEGATCTQPVGSIIGSDASYIYICASGGTVKRAAIN